MSGIALNEVDVVRKAPRRTYPLEFKLQVVKQTLVPGASVSMVAREHDINANIVFEWRGLYRKGRLGPSALTTPPMPARAELLPVTVIDSPGRLAPQCADRGEAAEQPHGAPPLGCEVEIEVGKRLVRIRGLSMDRAEQFFRECLL